MPKIEIIVDSQNNPSVKIDGKEISGLITELHLEIKPLSVPVVSVTLSAPEIEARGESSIVEQGDYSA